MCEIGVGFSFAALWVFRLRRAEAASALWIPHSLGAFRIARDAGGEAVREREPRRAGEASPKPPPKPPPKPRSGLCPELLADFRIPKPPGVLAGGTEGSFLCSPSSRFSGRGGGVGSLPRAWRRGWGASDCTKNCPLGPCEHNLQAPLFSGTWSARTRPEPTQGSWVGLISGVISGSICESISGAAPSSLLPTG